MDEVWNDADRVGERRVNLDVTLICTAAHSDSYSFNKHAIQIITKIHTNFLMYESEISYIRIAHLQSC